MVSFSIIPFFLSSISYLSFLFEYYSESCVSSAVQYTRDFA
jgi:hypothetical protein